MQLGWGGIIPVLFMKSDSISCCGWDMSGSLIMFLASCICWSL